MIPSLRSAWPHRFERHCCGRNSNGQGTSAKTASHPARSRGGSACPDSAGAGLLVVGSALIDRHPIRSAARWSERSMWTETINAAGRTVGFVSPSRICVDTVIRASRSGRWRGEVDNGWLSVQDSVACVRNSLDIPATWVTRNWWNGDCKGLGAYRIQVL